MRLPRMQFTVRRLMVVVAIIAVLVTIVLWNAGLTVLAVLVTFVPSFAWADTSGRFRRRE